MSRPLSRERAQQVDRIVAGIVERMVSGEWVAGKSHRELAEAEKVSVDRVKDWAAEAGRCLRVLAMTDKEDLRARNQARLDMVFSSALTDGAHAAAVGALAEQARLLGLNAPEKHEHAHTQAQAEWEKLPPVERPAWLRAQAARFLAAAEAAEEELRDAAALTVGVAKE